MVSEFKILVKEPLAVRRQVEGIFCCKPPYAMTRPTSSVRTGNESSRVQAAGSRCRSRRKVPEWTVKV